MVAYNSEKYIEYAIKNGEKDIKNYKKNVCEWVSVLKGKLFFDISGSRLVKTF